MSGSLRSFCVAACLVASLATSAWAQATAQMSGTVTDESGAVLPGVTVTATQIDTGLARVATTNVSGADLLSNLPTGPYRLEIALQGFRTYVQTGIVLQVAASLVINGTLPVGSLEESVAVEAAAPLVDVRSAGISDVVDNERIVELPLQGRQVTDLIVLAGAAVQTGTPPTHHFAGGVRVAVAGGQTFGVAYLLDGAMHNDLQSSGSMRPRSSPSRRPQGWSPSWVVDANAASLGLFGATRQHATHARELRVDARGGRLPPVQPVPASAVRLSGSRAAPHRRRSASIRSSGGHPLAVLVSP